MKQHRGIWLPDHEEHLLGWLDSKDASKHIDESGRPIYQGHKQNLALKYCRQFRTAVDIGAHCGLWSMHLARRFESLWAFEPVIEHRECWIRNVNSFKETVHLYPCALGEREGSVRISTVEGSSGDAHIVGDGDTPMKTLDSFELQDVDFIKVDTEGYELYALRGAQKTLLECRPVIIVEQKPGNAVQFGLGERDAIPWLEGLGARVREEYSGDFVLTWD